MKSLKRPNKKDTEKLHAEVNQILNQRIVLTTFAIAVFGAAITLLLSRQESSNEIDNFTYMASALLTVVLFALFLLNHFLTRQMRIITTYLDVTESSDWEKDWVTYKDKYRYMGYTKSMSIIFLVLGIMSFGFPVLLLAAYPTIKLEHRAGVLFCALIGTLYILFVWGMGMAGWFTDEDNIRLRWKELKELKELKQNNGKP